MAGNNHAEKMIHESRLNQLFIHSSKKEIVHIKMKRSSHLKQDVRRNHNDS